jgi:hypothetical protein
MTPAVKIVAIDMQNTDTPRNDGTAGSALYAVSVKLNTGPPPVWGRLFVKNWDEPSGFSLMHRPGIARVVGDRIVLDGTTIEEVRDVHIETLKLVVEATNSQMTAYEDQERANQRAKVNELAAHRDNLRKVASDIRFD